MLEDLMKAVLEGAQAQQRQPSQPKQAQTPQDGDILSEILRGVLQGGQQPQPAARPKQAEPDMFGMADLIAGVLGVGGSSGGGRQPQASNPIVNMVAGMLADKLGISPQIAMTIVSFAMAALMKKGGGQPGQTQPQGDRGLDLDDLLEGDYAWDSGLVSKLSQQTGMAEDEAAYGLQEAMMLLSGQTTPPPAKKRGAGAKKTTPRAAAPTRKSGLDHLLDTWETS